MTLENPPFSIGNTSTHSWWIFQLVMLVIHMDMLYTLPESNSGASLPLKIKRLEDKNLPVGGKNLIFRGYVSFWEGISFQLQKKISHLNSLAKSCTTSCWDDQGLLDVPLKTSQKQGGKCHFKPPKSLKVMFKATRNGTFIAKPDDLRQCCNGGNIAILFQTFQGVIPAGDERLQTCVSVRRP